MLIMPSGAGNAALRERSIAPIQSRFRLLVPALARSRRFAAVSSLATGRSAHHEHFESLTAETC